MLLPSLSGLARQSFVGRVRAHVSCADRRPARLIDQGDQIRFNPGPSLPQIQRMHPKRMIVDTRTQASRAFSRLGAGCPWPFGMRGQPDASATQGRHTSDTSGSPVRIRCHDRSRPRPCTISCPSRCAGARFGAAIRYPGAWKATSIPSPPGLQAPSRPAGEWEVRSHSAGSSFKAVEFRYESFVDPPLLLLQLAPTP